MASIGELVISLRADIANFRSGMDQANASLDTVRQHSSQTANELRSLKTYFEGFASIAGARELLSFADGLVETAARINDMTRALGVNAEQFQAQAYAAKLGGAGADVFGTSMERLAKNLDLVALGEGGKQIVEVFARLGLSAKNADGTIRSASDTLDDLAHNQLFQAESAGQKLADVMLLMGARSGEAGLIVNSLGPDFDKAKVAALALNQVLSKDNMDALERMKSRFETAGTAVKNFLAEMLAEAAKGEGFMGGIPFIGGMGAPAPGDKQPPPTPAANKPPGAPVVPGGDEKIKQLQNFQEEYAKLIQTYQEDASYQARLTAAYQQSAAAVRELQVQHAGEEAAEKAIALAERDHVAISTQEVAASFLAAAASKQATLAAQEQKRATDAMASGEKEHEAKVREVMDATDGLTKRNNDLVEVLGILQQEYQQGVIPTLEEYEQRAQAAQQIFSSGAGADKGLKEFSSGISADVNSMIGKMTDFSAIVAKTQGKKGQSVFSQFSQDADEFTASLEKLLLKLLIINPMLNALGLGDQGNGKQLPTLWGSSSAPGANPAGAGLGGMVGGVAGWLGKLFGNLWSSGTSGLPAPGFANGGEFVVGGIGGTDSQLVAFKATPGEKVAVGVNAERGSDARRSGPGDVTIVQNISTPNSDSFRANRHQITGDMIRAIKAGAGRYA